MKILGIGGACRQGSASERALQVACEAAAEIGAEITTITGPDLMLPMYGSEESSSHQGALRLVEAMRDAEGILIASPAYHGTISGMLKNALDYTEELRTDERQYLDGLAVGCIAIAGGWQAASSTLQSLRQISHALRAWPTPFGAAINSTASIQDEPGPWKPDEAATNQLRMVGHQVVQFGWLATGNSIPDGVPTFGGRTSAASTPISAQSASTLRPTYKATFNS